jgi:hypothetical protein
MCDARVLLVAFSLLALPPLTACRTDGAEGEGEGEGEGDERFAGCPATSTYAGPSSGVPWSMAPVRSVYCGEANEGRTLLQEIAVKLQVAIASGAYFLPTTAGTAPLTLPLCAVDDEGLLLSPAGAGEVQTWHSTFGSTTDIWEWVVTQPLTDTDGVAWTAQLRINRTVPTGAPPESVAVDGSYVFDFENNVGISVCRPDCAAPEEVRSFESCTFDGVDVQRHTVVFDGGDVVLDLPIGESLAATEPAMFVRAAGTLDGETFVVDDYFDLVYHPAHHHFQRSFLVFFPAPLGQACGLSVVELDPFDPESLDVVSVVDCNGAPLGTRTVLSATREVIAR